MRAKTMVLYAVLVILVLTTVVATYEWLNVAVSLNHARQQQKTDRDRTEVLYRLLTASAGDLKRPALRQFVDRALGKNHVIKEDQHRIIVDNIVFQFDDTDSLAKVYSLDYDDTQ